MRTESGSVSMKSKATSETLRSPTDHNLTDKSISLPFLIKKPSGEASMAVPDSSLEVESHRLKIQKAPCPASKIIKPAHSLQKIIMLIVAVEKFKKMMKTTFKDADLLEFDLRIKEVITKISYDHTAKSSSSFNFMWSEAQKLRDYEDKCLVLSPSSKLFAVALQTPQPEVTLDVRHYKTLSFDAQPVVLGIKDQNKFLSCTGPHSNPELRVEDFDKNLNNISSTTQLLRFVFYKKVSSMGRFLEFESANHPSWYISTSTQNRQVVEMEVKENKRITLFTAIKS